MCIRDSTYSSFDNVGTLGWHGPHRPHRNASLKNDAEWAMAPRPRIDGASGYRPRFLMVRHVLALRAAHQFDDGMGAGHAGLAFAGPWMLPYASFASSGSMLRWHLCVSPTKMDGASGYRPRITGALRARPPGCAERASA